MDDRYIFHPTHMYWPDLPELQPAARLVTDATQARAANWHAYDQAPSEDREHAWSLANDDSADSIPLEPMPGAVVTDEYTFLLHKCDFPSTRYKMIGLDPMDTEDILEEFE